jgi:hypothetical protein
MGYLVDMLKQAGYKVNPLDIPKSTKAGVGIVNNKKSFSVFATKTPKLVNKRQFGTTSIQTQGIGTATSPNPARAGASSGLGSGNPLNFKKSRMQ